MVLEMALNLMVSITRGLWKDHWPPVIETIRFNAISRTIIFYTKLRIKHTTDLIWPPTLAI
jgi:hypothetical protein